MLTDAAKARSHELMLEQDQTLVQGSEEMSCVHEAYQYLVKRYITEKKDIGAAAKKTKEKKTSKSSTKSATEEMEQLNMKKNSSEEKSSGESEGDEENK